MAFSIDMNDPRSTFMDEEVKGGGGGPSKVRFTENMESIRRNQ